MMPSIPHGTWLQAVAYLNEDHQADPAEALSEHRCLCGKLLFQVSAAGIFLKCPRCKRTALLPVPELVAQIQFQARDLESRAERKSLAAHGREIATDEVAPTNNK